MQFTSHGPLSQEATGGYVLPSDGVIHERRQYGSQEAAKEIPRMIEKGNPRLTPE